jgi:hypothetical protein
MSIMGAMETWRREANSTWMGIREDPLTVWLVPEEPAKLANPRRQRRAFQAEENEEKNGPRHGSTGFASME